jgi:hypothetical protein
MCVYCTEFTDFFWTFSIALYSKKTRRFGNWICFRPQVNVGEKTPTQLGPLRESKSQSLDKPRSLENTL